MIYNIKSITAIILILFTSNAFTQNLEVDAIKFGTNNNDGSARFVAVGGAMSAIGGDITSLSYNPAGIAVYKSSIATITPSFEINKSNSVFNNSSRQMINHKFDFSNAGLVFSFNKNKGKYTYLNVGLSMTNLNSFNQKNEYRQNTNNSITNNWVNEATAVNGNEEKDFTYDNFSFETVGAYNTWLVNFDTTSLTYSSPIINNILQRKVSETKGGKRDFGLNFSLNFIDKFYIGASVAIPSIQYETKSTFVEDDVDDVNDDFKKFKLSQVHEYSGTGVNLKLGAIYRPISFLRLSAAYQTQTNFRLTEEYTSDFITEFDTETFENKSSKGKFEYNLLTPWRANAGIALVGKHLGFIAFDYEVVDYSSIKFELDDVNYLMQDRLNSKMKDKYQMSHNFKIGAEAKLLKYRLRAGYNIQTSPLKTAFREGKFDFSRQQISAGIGYVWKRVALDFAYRYSFTNEYEMSFDGINGITKNRDSQQMLVSVTYKLSK